MWTEKGRKGKQQHEKWRKIERLKQVIGKMGATKPNTEKGRRKLLSGTRKRLLDSLLFVKAYEFMCMRACFFVAYLLVRVLFFLCTFLPSFYFSQCILLNINRVYLTPTRLLHLYVSIWIRIRPRWWSLDGKRFGLPTYREWQSSIR